MQYEVLQCCVVICTCCWSIWLLQLTCVNVTPLERAVGMAQKTPRPTARAGGCRGSCTTSRPSSGVSSRMDSRPYAIAPGSREGAAVNSHQNHSQTHRCLTPSQMSQALRQCANNGSGGMTCGDSACTHHVSGASVWKVLFVARTVWAASRDACHAIHGPQPGAMLPSSPAADSAAAASFLRSCSPCSPTGRCCQSATPLIMIDRTVKNCHCCTPVPQRCQRW